MRVRYSFGSRHTGNIENIEKQRKKYPDIVTELMDITDIILQVLDARFLTETRNLAIEEKIKESGKKLIYVINKIDLVETEGKKEELKKLGLYPYELVSCTKRIGGGKLRDRIKMEAGKVVLPHDSMRRVQVGVIGYPNTGKSSILNLLTGRTAAAVGAEAGYTKGMQKVRLTADILILDTPGVIPDDKYSGQNIKDRAAHAKVGARDYGKIKDPELMIAEIMKTGSKQIETFYGVEVEGDTERLIEEVGKKKNFLKKGGLVDDTRTARLILKDWQDGSIKN